MNDDFLSPHFRLGELVYSATALRHGIDNTPPPEAVENLRWLCNGVLEPVRALLNCPLDIDSGYRSEELNRVVGSTAPHSAHLDGRAADFIPFSMDLREALDKIRASAIPFDQVIIELGWLHISCAVQGQDARREALVASGGPGHWVYSTVA